MGGLRRRGSSEDTTEWARLRGIAAYRGRDVDVQLCHLSVQRAERDAQALSRRLLVGRLCQDALDVQTLETPHRLFEVVHQARVVLDDGEVRGQVGDGDERPV